MSPQPVKCARITANHASDWVFGCAQLAGIGEMRRAERRRQAASVATNVTHAPPIRFVTKLGYAAAPVRATVLAVLRRHVAKPTSASSTATYPIT